MSFQVSLLFWEESEVTQGQECVVWWVHQAVIYMLITFLHQHDLVSHGHYSWSPTVQCSLIILSTQFVWALGALQGLTVCFCDYGHTRRTLNSTHVYTIILRSNFIGQWMGIGRAFSANTAHCLFDTLSYTVIFMAVIWDIWW